MKRLLLWVPSIGLGTGGLVMAGLRIKEGIYMNGQSWYPHEARLLFVTEIRRYLETDIPLRDILPQLEGDFPPLLHGITWLASPFIGHSVEAVRWTGLAWFFLLALAVASVAHSIAGSARGPRDRARREASAAAPAAFAITLMMASLQGMTMRYYYDLPMIALVWGALALLLRWWNRRPRLAAAGFGIGMVAATLTKWTTLALGGVTLFGLVATAVTASSGTRRRKLVACGLGGALWLSIVLAYTMAAGRDGSLQATLGHTFDVPTEGAQPASTLWMAAQRVASALPERLSFYSANFVTAVVSPALTGALGVLTLLWLLFRRSGALLLATIFFGELAFVVLTVLILDDRFLLPLLPALLISAALGWAVLGPRLRLLTAVAVSLLAFTVSWDFHFRDNPHFVNQPTGLGLEGADSWGLASSFRRDTGWIRGDGMAAAGPYGNRQLDGADQGAFFDRVLAATLQCDTVQFAVPEGQPPWSIIPDWWDNLLRVAELEGDPFALERVPFDPSLLNVSSGDPEHPQAPPNQEEGQAESSGRTLPGLIISASPLAGTTSDFPGERRLQQSALVERIYRITDAGISEVSFWRPVGGSACTRLKQKTDQ